MHITLLCKVVDNYGDIGFVYRFARSLSQKYPEHKISIVVSNLLSFGKMAPDVKNVPYQKYKSWDVLDWNDENACKKYFSENPVQLILECFQCGRPEWLDEILFDKNRKDVVQILNVEYLTAEDWAEDFHLLKSGTRSSLVKKINFMPGFTNKTGGLVLDKEFMENLMDKKIAIKKIQTSLDFFKFENYFNATVFAYDKNMENLVCALKRFQTEQKKLNSDFKLNVFAASGLSFKSFEDAWTKHGKPFELTPLPYLNQENWDALLTLCDFNFIRGEDSFSRACLCGKPFLWNAYVQDEEFQLIKVRAVVDLMEKFFIQNNSQNSFYDFLNAMMIYNQTHKNEPCYEAEDSLANVDKTMDEEQSIFNLLMSSQNPDTKKSFVDFSQSLIQNGNLVDHLSNFIK